MVQGEVTEVLVVVAKVIGKAWGGQSGNYFKFFVSTRTLSKGVYS